jgi:hypothetical protein
MQGSQGESAFREACIDLLDAKGQGAKAPTGCRKPAKLLAQHQKTRIVPGIVHALP